MEWKLFFQTIFAGVFLWFLIYNTTYLFEQRNQTSDFVQPNLKVLMKEEIKKELQEEQLKEIDESTQNLRILIPVVIYGPNNQYQGFRESIMIAKLLHRKVKFYIFYEHVIEF